MNDFEFEYMQLSPSVYITLQGYQPVKVVSNQQVQVVDYRAVGKALSSPSLHIQTHTPKSTSENCNNYNNTTNNKRKHRKSSRNGGKYNGCQAHQICWCSATVSERNVSIPCAAAAGTAEAVAVHATQQQDGKEHSAYTNKVSRASCTSLTTTVRRQLVTSRQCPPSFSMLFASCAKHAPALQQQLTSLQQLKEPSVLQHHQAPAASTVALVNEEAKEAMRKLDAKLIAYLAGEDMPAKLESEEAGQLALESLQDSVDEMVKERIREQQLQLFKSMCSIKLQLEALTLEPEGTKRMELLQSEIRPIFTVECQLSHELIKNMPRYDMFHIMQFESEKFHSLTQCTRFGQEDERNVKLCLDELDAAAVGAKQAKPNFGRIHFTVWWREPGTCLNEMLGMGVLELEELYNASLLEQCKRITIKRRGILLANLYLKISLQLQPDNNNTIVQADVQQLSELLEHSADHNGNNGGEESTKQPQHVDQQNMNTQAADTVAAAATTVAATDAAAANAAALPSNNNANSNFQLESSSFAAETTKVRLLKGFIYASETRNLEMNSNREYVLVCRRFWQEQAVAQIAGEGGNFNYQEQFGVINDEQFLSRVDRQHLQLEVWQRRRMPASDAADGNGNQATADLEPIGVVQLPLHQFYIAYRDEAMANRLCKGKLPVISIDAWVPIVNQQQQNRLHCGELKCLLAIGSEEQIIHLKATRGFTSNTEAIASRNIDNALFAHNRINVANNSSTQTTGKATNTTNTNTELKKRTELLDMLQKALQSPPKATALAATGAQSASAATPLKLLQPKMFKFELEIVGATGLPLNPAAKGKKNAKRNANAAASKRFPPNEAPSTYVTFQADECQGSELHKSHEGAVYATGIVEKCTRPQWQQHFRISSSVDYLKNPQQRFILKIWKKAATNAAAQQRLQPTPMDDAIIGFAALDLTVFLRDLQIAGWFNIVDFNGRINGQLELRAKPLENVHKVLQHTPPPPVAAGSASEAHTMDAVIDQFENSLDLTQLNLGQAIKRKFTELEEISQRLRTRLAHVTGEQLASQFDINTLDSWQPLDVAAAASDDADLDEFERYINTAPSTSSAADALATDEANKNEIMISTKQESADRPDE